MATPSPRPLALTEWSVSPPPRQRHHLRWIERLLFAIAVLSLGAYAYIFAEARLYQTFEDNELDSVLATGPESPAVAGATLPQRVAPPAGSTIGRIEIPRLGVSAVIRAGSDARTLRLAVGYIPGTALPGEPGNVGLAAHRDTFFRKLRDINPDDEIRITTTAGVFRYYVERTNIVNPSDVWVLNATDAPALTLVTCYPFTYIGSAPQRFIVRAALRAPPLVSAALSRR